MSHAFGNLPYGRLPRDILEIALDNNFKKHSMKLYAWIVVNSNQWNGQLLRKPSLEDLKDTLGMSLRQLWYVLDLFSELGIFQREKGILGMQGNAPHIQLVRKEVILLQTRHLREEAPAEKHPLGHLVYGRLPRAFVQIAVESDLSKKAQQLYWWVCLNTSEAGTTTRLEDVVDLAETLKMGKRTFFRALSELDKTGLFSVERESVFRGTAPHIKSAIDEAAELAFEKKRDAALKQHLEAEEAECLEKLGRNLNAEERKALTEFFLETYIEATEPV